MGVIQTIGPKVTQLIMYNDSVYGSVAAMITAVAAGTGLISVTTFPPGASPQTYTGVQYDYTGSIVGSWHYKETEVM